jgi:tetratricopeptide (TPR) repeat protein
MTVSSFIRSIRMYLLVAGILCLSFGIYQKYWYSDLIEDAVKAMESNQLDRQYLERAKKSLLSSDGLISYNMGVRAFQANNLKKASVHFYDVVQNSKDADQKKRAYYNLGNILVLLELPKKAAEMYQESLRIDPNIWESKYNLERLYVFYPSVFPNGGEQASLDQEPGNKKGDKKQLGRPGQGQPDI